MERVTNKQITGRVARLVKEGIDFGLDSQYGRFRVTNKTGKRDISPRLPNRQLMDWLDAYEQGWDAGKEYQFNKMRKEAADAFAGDREGSYR